MVMGERRPVPRPTLARTRLMVNARESLEANETRSGTRRPTYTESMSEAEFERWFTDLFTIHGWSMHYHTRNSKGSDKGWPDWVLGRPSTGELIFVELKAHRGRPTREQRKWLGFLDAMGLRTYIWYPGDRPVIEAVLARPRG